MRESFSQSSMTPERLKEMSAQERIDFFRGCIPDYSTRVHGVIDKNFGDREESVKERIFNAFRQRVEDYFAYPGGPGGGGPLDHLPQMGVSLVTEEEYQELQASAAALAGTIMSQTGLEDYAQHTYAELGRMVAKKEFPSSKNL